MSALELLLELVGRDCVVAPFPEEDRIEVLRGAGPQGAYDDLRDDIRRLKPDLLDLARSGWWAWPCLHPCAGCGEVATRWIGPDGDAWHPTCWRAAHGEQEEAA